MTTAIPCFYIPKTLVTEQKYAGFSGESKLLFGMILTNAEHTKAIMELSRLIAAIDTEDLAALKHQLDLDLQQKKHYEK